MILVNWSILIVIFCMGLVGIWTAHSFLNKKGLYLFCILATLLSSMMLTKADLFGLAIDYAVVIMPLTYFALLTCYHKYGKDEAKRLFFITLIAMAIVFVLKFFESAYIDSASQAQICLNWKYLGLYISNIIAFVSASALTMFIVSKINVKSLNNFLKLSVYLAIASIIDMLIFTILVSMGVLSFGEILLSILIKTIIVCVACLLLGYFEKFLNRKVEKKLEDKKEEKSVEQKIEEKNEVENQEEDIKISAPEDIS